MASTVIIKNNVAVLQNTSGGSAYYRSGATASVTSSNNASQDNTAGIHGGTGHLTGINPSIQFFAINSDWRILASSSLRNAGTPLTDNQKDFQGQQRGNGGAWDIGADEYHTGERASMSANPMVGSMTSSLHIIRMRRQGGITSTLGSSLAAAILSGGDFAVDLTSTLTASTVAHRRRRSAIVSDILSDMAVDLNNRLELASAMTGELGGDTVIRTRRRLAVAESLRGQIDATIIASSELLSVSLIGSMPPPGSATRRGRRTQITESIEAQWVSDLNNRLLLALDLMGSLDSDVRSRTLRRMAPAAVDLHAVMLTALSRVLAHGDSWYLEESQLNHLFNLGAYTPTSVYLGLTREPPSLYDTGQTIAEPIDSNYGRTLVPSSWWSVNVEGEGGTTQDVTFPTASEAWPGLRYLCLLDSPLGGRLLKWATLGQTISVAAGSTFTLTPLASSRFRYALGSPISTSWKRVLNGFVLRQKQPQMTGNLSIALLLAQPDNVARGVGLPEPITRDYRRVPVGLGSNVWEQSGEWIVNKQGVDFGVAASGWGRIKYYALTTTPNGGEMILWNAFDPDFFVLEGDHVVVPAGGLRFRLQP